jgi:hypothetical protein
MRLLPHECGVPIVAPKDALIQPVAVLLWTRPVNFNN